MKATLISLFIVFSLQVSATIPVMLDIHFQQADVFYPLEESTEAGHILADRIIITTDFLTLKVDQDKEVFDADLFIDNNFLFFDTAFATLSTQLKGVNGLFEPIKELKTTDTSFIYNNAEIFASITDLSALYNDVKITSSNTELACQNYSEKKSYNKDNIFIDCLNNANLTPKDDKDSAKLTISYNQIDLNSELELLAINSDNVQLSSSIFDLNTENYQFRFNDLQAYCIKEEVVKKLKPQIYINGCFEESYISLSTFEMNSENTQVVGDIKLLQIGGSRLRVTAPLITVNTNKDQTELKEVKVACNKKINSIEDINFDKFVEGCLENALINVTGITSESEEKKTQAQQEMIDGGSKKEIRKAKKESKGFSLDDFSQLELSSVNGDVTFLGKVKVLFLLPEFEIKAKAKYVSEESTIHFEVEEATVAGFIPVKKILLYFLEKFIPEGNLSVDGNNISIKLR